MAKTISHEVLSETVAITECTDGWWLYDETQGMNLAMRAESRDAAFMKAITYYQRRLLEVETSHRTLQRKVDAFVSQFVEDFEGED